MIDKFTALVPILKPKSTEMYAYFKTLFREDVYFTSEPPRLAVESSQKVLDADEIEQIFRESF